MHERTARSRVKQHRADVERYRSNAEIADLLDGKELHSRAFSERKLGDCRRIDFHLVVPAAAARRPAEAIVERRSENLTQRRRSKVEFVLEFATDSSRCRFTGVAGSPEQPPRIRKADTGNIFPPLQQIASVRGKDHGRYAIGIEPRTQMLRSSELFFGIFVPVGPM